MKLFWKTKLSWIGVDYCLRKLDVRRERCGLAVNVAWRERVWVRSLGSHMGLISHHIHTITCTDGEEGARWIGSERSLSLFDFLFSVTQTVFALPCRSSNLNRSRFRVFIGILSALDRCIYRPCLLAASMTKQLVPQQLDPVLSFQTRGD